MHLVKHPGGLVISCKTAGHPREQELPVSQSLPAAERSAFPSYSPAGALVGAVQRKTKAKAILEQDSLTFILSGNLKTQKKAGSRGRRCGDGKG